MVTILIMAQYMRYASKYSYSKLSMNVMNEAMSTLSQKCDSSTGNTWLFLCNLKAYQDVNKELAAFLANQNTNGAYLYSKFEGQKLKIGAEYAAYTWLGNTILFKLDDALTTEYPDKGFAILVDQSTDTATGTSSWSMFTLRGKSFIDNTLKGVGIESGNVATGVAGGKDIVSGYSGVMVRNPYRAYVMIQN